MVRECKEKGGGDEQRCEVAALGSSLLPSSSWIEVLIFIAHLIISGGEGGSVSASIEIRV